MITITDHAYNREYNNKISNEDFIQFIEKLIKAFNLAKQKDGFFRIYNQEMTSIIRKQKDDYTLITMYANQYIDLHFNIDWFQCIYQGEKQSDRSKIKIPRIGSKTYKPKTIGQKRKEEKVEIFKKLKLSRIQFKANVANSKIKELYPTAAYLIKPKKNKQTNRTLIVNSNGNILKQFEIQQLLQVQEGLV